MARLTGKLFRSAVYVIEQGQDAFMAKLEELNLVEDDFPDGWEEAATAMICAAVETALEERELPENPKGDLIQTDQGVFRSMAMSERQSGAPYQIRAEEPYQENPELRSAGELLEHLVRPVSNGNLMELQMQDLRKQLLARVANLKSTNKTERGDMKESCEEGWQKALTEMENSIKEIVK